MVSVGEKDSKTKVFCSNGEDEMGAVVREGLDMGLDSARGGKRLRVKARR